MMKTILDRTLVANRLSRTVVEWDARDIMRSTARPAIRRG
jgi:hypothetical protein